MTGSNIMVSKNQIMHKSHHLSCYLHREYNLYFICLLEILVVTPSAGHPFPVTVQMSPSNALELATNGSMGQHKSTLHSSTDKNFNNLY